MAAAPATIFAAIDDLLHVGVTLRVRRDPAR
jgi:hypothetical protein